MKLKRYMVGKGIDAKYGNPTNVDFNPWYQEKPIIIWFGENINQRGGGAYLRLTELGQFLWAFECTGTMWLYDFLKALPPEQVLTYELVNAEYFKRHGKDMEFVEEL